MRLLTLRLGGGLRVGAAVGGYAIDLERASRALSSGALPPSARALLAGGEPLLARARKAVRRAEAKLTLVDKKAERRPAWAIPLETADLAPPIPDPEKIICVGQNYSDHCREQGLEPPKSPIIFAKFATTLAGPRDVVRLPPTDLASLIDYEVELAFVIGRECKGVAAKDAMGCVAGYMVLNDITARDVQKGDGQWVRGKSFDTFAPCGPHLVTSDEIPDPHRLGISLKLNGATMQESATENLIFSIPFLIEYLSRGITFRPGDIVSTGTPPGVGIFRKPPVILKPGDFMEATVEGLGVLENRCARA